MTTTAPNKPASQETVTLEPRVYCDFSPAFLAQETDGRDIFEVTTDTEPLYVLAKTEHQAVTAAAKHIITGVRKLKAQELIRLSREQMKPE